MLRDNQTTEITTSELVFDTVNKSHAGIYRFTVVLPPQENYPQYYRDLTGNITVTVLDIPTFNRSVEHINEEAGKAVCNPITADGSLLDQPYKRTWRVHRLLRDGTVNKTEINANTFYDHFEVSSNGEVLRFRNLIFPAYFTCTVMNEVGNATLTTILLHRQRLALCTEGEADTDRLLSVLKVSTNCAERISRSVKSLAFTRCHYYNRTSQ